MNDNETSKKLDRLEQATIEMRATVVSHGPPEELIASTIEALELSNQPNEIRRIERRKIMFRIAGISSIAAAVVASFSMMAVLIGGPSLAVADIKEAIENARYVRCLQTERNRNTEGLGDIEEVIQTRTMYFDLKGRRSRVETEYKLEKGPLTFVTIQDDRQAKRIMLNPQKKTALLTVSPKPEDLESLRHPFEQILQIKGTKITHKEWEGKEYVFVTSTDDNNGVKGTTSMWLDKKTLLPFRVEYALPKLKLWYTMSDFEWMKQLEDADRLFRIEAPNEYELTIDDKS